MSRLSRRMNVGAVAVGNQEVRPAVARRDPDVLQLAADADFLDTFRSSRWMIVTCGSSSGSPATSGGGAGVTDGESAASAGGVGGGGGASARTRRAAASARRSVASSAAATENARHARASC